MKFVFLVTLFKFSVSSSNKAFVSSLNPETFIFFDFCLLVIYSSFFGSKKEISYSGNSIKPGFLLLAKIK